MKNYSIKVPVVKYCFLLSLCFCLLMPLVAETVLGDRPAESDVATLYTDLSFKLSNENCSIYALWKEYLGNWPHTFSSTSNKVSATISGPVDTSDFTCNGSILNLLSGPYVINGTMVSIAKNKFDAKTVYSLVLTGGTIKTIDLSFLLTPDTTTAPTATLVTILLVVNGYTFDVKTQHYIN